MEETKRAGQVTWMNHISAWCWFPSLLPEPRRGRTAEPCFPSLAVLFLEERSQHSLWKVNCVLEAPGAVLFKGTQGCGEH